MKHIFVIAAVALCVLAGSAQPVAAQIHSWVDDNGVLVLANRAKDSAERVLSARPAVTAQVGTSHPLAAAYESLIRRHAIREGVRPELVRAVIMVESAFNPLAVSPKGAMGLMQLMPATARQFGVKDAFDPAQNIRAGVAYLRQLLERYDHNEQLALAAYNAGPGAVDKYGSRIPPYKETQNYVQKITGMRGTVRNAPGVRIYRVTKLVDGHPVVTYTNTKPASGDYEEVRR